jgi:uncharacterized membrane-anchored protein YhcB (DUF1043 family)
MFSVGGLVGLVVGLVIGFVIGYLVKRNNPTLEKDLRSNYALLKVDMKADYDEMEKNLQDEIARLKAKIGA